MAALGDFSSPSALKRTAITSRTECISSFTITDPSLLVKLMIEDWGVKESDVRILNSD